MGLRCKYFFLNSEKEFIYFKFLPSPHPRLSNGRPLITGLCKSFNLLQTPKINHWNTIQDLSKQSVPFLVIPPSGITFFRLFGTWKLSKSDNPSLELSSFSCHNTTTCVLVWHLTYFLPKSHLAFLCFANAVLYTSCKGGRKMLLRIHFLSFS